ncbi:cytochrome c [Metabacillus sp. GX 13764]|uniref:cytochrome c551 n=1 Tax=Metabacillus kandeliae TaxID=2900151 RepID=UPI001E46D84C|nr:cytochrome c [Metabacillus kandeliae]MCD7035964.1 cytochrome c [Metabacillus kandeliae]
MKRKIAALILGTSFVLAACGGGGGSDSKTATESANGPEVFKQNCSSCHGGDLKGGYGPSLEKVGAEHNAEEIQKIIENGKGNMPPNILGGDKAAEEAVAKWLSEKK